MSEVSVAVVGAGPPNTGRNPEHAGKDGFSVAYRHAPCYLELEETELVGVADIVPENAGAFAEHFGIPSANVYEDFLAMIEELDVDMIDVCTPAPTHADIVVDAARSGNVGAIHSEKPMARTWGECERMAEVTDEEGVQLTFNHQRRFGDPFREAKALLDDGAIGDLERMEFGAGVMYSYGSHSLDLCGLFNDEERAEWVIAQIDYREENIYSSGAHNENQAIVQWQYENGVYGLAATGTGSEMVGCHHRLHGTDGVIEIAPEADGSADPPILRIKQPDTTGWEPVDCGDNGTGGLTNGYPYMIRSIGEAVEAFLDGRTSELDVTNAMKATEIIFATYESSRKRGRVDLPLEIDDNPLEAMVESGALSPEPAPDSATD
jgi:predicted dehydrogenase